MAGADYHHCALCGRKAFYDADINDPRYLGEKDFDPITVKALCSECTKTHDLVVRPTLSLAILGLKERDQ